jgi:tryptophan synthase alpha chain
VSRFADAFARLRAERRPGLFPYLMPGFPDLETSRRLAEAALDAGADGFEVAVPFSDPLADGATMQRANARALANGANLDSTLELVQFIRGRSPRTPVAVMSYCNPLVRRDLGKLAAELEAVGADAVIAADVPVEESQPLRGALLERGIGLVPLLAPTSSDARVRLVTELEPVFIYCVALVGVTGARAGLAGGLDAFLARVRAAGAAPLVVGFGIAKPEHVRAVAALGADGAIVASALCDLVERSADPVAAARAYLAEMKGAQDFASPAGGGRP